MSVQMTTTAWKQGAKNAAVCAVGIVLVWLLTTAGVWVATGKPLWESLALAFGVLWGCVFVLFLATWMYHRQRGGQILLDCGSLPLDVAGRQHGLEFSDSSVGDFRLTHREVAESWKSLERYQSGVADLSSIKS